MILSKITKQIEFIKRWPIIRGIPGFNSLPKDITEKNLRFYKLSNLVLTLGMFVHAFWITIFLYLQFIPLTILNAVSVTIYIICIIINRKGFHFTSSILMVLEIILHQSIVINAIGLDCGFQYYIIVIGLFPFLMPKGKWTLKVILLALCLLSYIFLEVYYKSKYPMYEIPDFFISFFRISNIIFSFTSLAISGAYFNIAMHETETLLENKSKELFEQKAKTEELLLNILPLETAEELKNTGTTIPKYFNEVTVIFTDFKNFTRMSEVLNAEELVAQIHYYYCEFDKIMSEFHIEKIKTIGDSYMAVAGVPIDRKTHAIDSIRAAIKIKKFIETEKQVRIKRNLPYFEIRIGIHSGPVVAGVVGTKKFAYDIWGDTVNIASRMESSCTTGEINVSGATFEIAKNTFGFSYRGKIEAKNKGNIDMYFVENLK